MINFENGLESEWTLTTDMGEIVNLPCCPWIIQNISKFNRYKVVCEFKTYWVLESEAKRLQSQSRLHRSAQLLDKALKEMIKE
jgi:hypothetical protein